MSVMVKQILDEGHAKRKRGGGLQAAAPQRHLSQRESYENTRRGLYGFI